MAKYFHHKGTKFTKGLKTSSPFIFVFFVLFVVNILFVRAKTILTVR